MIKYVIHPGYVPSKTDRNRHHIGAHMLMRLYHVNPAECVIDDGFPNLWPADAIHLYPNYHGDYTLPESRNDR
jgi:hypothetical protein